MTKPRSRRGWFLLVTLSGLAMAATILACTVMNDLHLPPPPPEDAAVVVDAGDADPCVMHARPPSAPTRFIGGEDAKNDILVALRSFAVIDVANANAPAGLDIDGLCTCAPDPDSCLVRGKPDAGAGTGTGTTSGAKATHCDGDGGRDNAVAALFQKLMDLTQYDPIAAINTRIVDGLSGYLIHVERYNGEADDSDVVVSVYSSIGTVSRLTDGGMAGPKPFFDARDQWILDKELLLGDPALHFSKITTALGYVSDHTLVAPLDLRFPLITSTNTTLKGGLVVGKITTGGDNKPTIATGVITGRWPTSEMLSSLGQTQSLNGEPFCKVPGFGAYVKGEVCIAADVTIDPSADRTKTPCDALSIGLVYHSVPASFGPAVDVPIAADRCGDAGVIVCDP